MRTLLAFIAVTTILGQVGLAGGTPAEKLATILNDHSMTDTARIRSLELFAENAANDPNARKLLIRELIQDEIFPLEAQYVLHTLKTANCLRAEEVWQVYKDTRQLCDESVVCALLGVTGKQMERLLPTLHAEMNEPWRRAESKYLLRAAATISGCGQKEDITEVWQAIKSDSHERSFLFFILFQTGLVDWIPEDGVKSLTDLLNDNPVLSWKAGMVLGHMGPKAASAVAALERVKKSAIGDEQREPGTIPYCLALARIDQARRSKWLQEVIRYLGAKHENERACTQLRWECGLLVDAYACREAASAIDSNDMQMVKGAIALLETGGAEARQYAPKVMHILRTCRDDEVATQAAVAMSMLARNEDVPAIQALVADSSTDSMVRTYLKEALKIRGIASTESNNVKQK